MLCTRLSHVDRRCLVRWLVSGESSGPVRIRGHSHLFPFGPRWMLVIRPSQTYADSRLGNSHFCFCALPRSSFSTLVFLMEHWSPVSSVGSVNVVRYAADGVVIILTILNYLSII